MLYSLTCERDSGFLAYSELANGIYLSGSSWEATVEHVNLPHQTPSSLL